MAYALVVEETREAVALAPQGIKDKLILRRADVVGVQPEPQLLYDEQRGSTRRKKAEAVRRNAARAAVAWLTGCGHSACVPAEVN